MRLLVTGSSGYVGSHLVPALKKRGHTVVGIDRDAPGDPARAPDRFVQGDLMDEQVLERGFESEVEGVFHLAAAKDDWGISEKEFFRENVDVVRALLEASRRHGVRRHLFYSTVAVHGPSEKAASEEAPMAPITPYGASKGQAEQLYRAFAKDVDEAEVAVLRPSVIYGPRNPSDTNIYRLIEAIRTGRFVMVGEGKALKTTSYIDNTIAATLFLWEHLDPGCQAFIYADDPVLATRELVERICHALGRRPPRWSLPLKPTAAVTRVLDLLAAVLGVNLPITSARIRKFNRSTFFDASKIRARGFEQPTGNAEALARTIEWHVNEVQ